MIASENVKIWFCVTFIPLGFSSRSLRSRRRTPVSARKFRWRQPAVCRVASSTTGLLGARRSNRVGPPLFRPGIRTVRGLPLIIYVYVRRKSGERQWKNPSHGLNSSRSTPRSLDSKPETMPLLHRTPRKSHLYNTDYVSWEDFEPLNKILQA